MGRTPLAGFLRSINFLITIGPLSTNVSRLHPSTWRVEPFHGFSGCPATHSSRRGRHSFRRFRPGSRRLNTRIPFEPFASSHRKPQSPITCRSLRISRTASLAFPPPSSLAVSFPASRRKSSVKSKHTNLLPSPRPRASPNFRKKNSLSCDPSFPLAARDHPPPLFTPPHLSVLLPHLLFPHPLPNRTLRYPPQILAPTHSCRSSASPRTR